MRRSLLECATALLATGILIVSPGCSSAPSSGGATSTTAQSPASAAAAEDAAPGAAANQKPAQRLVEAPVVRGALRVPGRGSERRLDERPPFLRQAIVEPNSEVVPTHRRITLGLADAKQRAEANATAARMAYEGSGWTAKDVDVFNPYDGYSWFLPFFLEAFGWHGAKKGEARDFFNGDITVEGPHPFCSGGGNLGSIQVGMLKALIQAGIEPGVLVATSIGSVNAAYLAATMERPESQAQTLCDAWRSLEIEEMIGLGALDLVRAMRFLLSRNPPPPEPGATVPSFTNRISRTSSVPVPEMRPRFTY